ncbi:hypothetical protein MTO96_018864 [Rhipicephalus appendiculatus]
MADAAAVEREAASSDAPVRSAAAFPALACAADGEAQTTAPSGRRRQLRAAERLSSLPSCTQHCGSSCLRGT